MFSKPTKKKGGHINRIPFKFRNIMKYLVFGLSGQINYTYNQMIE